MPRKPAGGEAVWTDPDDAPVLTKAFFAAADVYEGERLLRRGRPRSSGAPRTRLTSPHAEARPSPLLTGAVEKTRTSTGCPTATSTLRVYQFRHDRPW
jgi:hypothetical protein